jgi:hypothetical protein
MAFNWPMGSAGKPPAKKPPMGKPPAEPEQEMGEGQQEPEDGAEIAQMHGPAHDVHIQHEHEMGSHHVTSEHPDGHHHESDHESAEAAHEHGKKLAGAGGEAPMEHEPDEGGMDQGGEEY